ncbi:BED-type domain-containing protein [Citrus sinensis]|uniref:BED-type domain-containing protein n=1 Tax=Citrus sinensis TaxID=2711 RepID=A0ACB8IKD3_CITSI|nr:BED-type domain-containing protein [Citrus sinensis]
MENYDEEEVQEVEVDDGKKRKIPLRSNVWAHFTKLPCGNKGKCHHCRKTFAANRGNTINLKNHLDRCKSYQDEKVEGDPKQQVLFRQKGKDKDDGVFKVSGGFSQEACRMALVKMIVKDELPFSFVEAEGFLEFMQTCCPRFDVPSRRTITRDILELYQHEKGLLKSVLGANKQRVCITTDTWTSIQMPNYMVITTHFIDVEWVLHKRILSFTLIANHKGDGIRKLIEACLIDWEIERLFTITVDNASANKVVITYVKKKLANWSVNSMVLNGLYMHVRCSTHIINLIVQDGFAEVNHSIASIHNAVNSTYLMLHKAVVFEKAFNMMKEDDGHYVNWFVEDKGEKKREGPPSDDDWANARSMYESRKVEELKSNIKELLMKLYNNYIGGSDVRNSGGVCFGEIHNSSSGGGGGGSSSIMSIDLFSSFKMMKQSSNDDISLKNDVEKYLTNANESTSNAHFDILTWWKLNGHRYPILSQISKDVLAIPVSTVA